MYLEHLICIHLVAQILAYSILNLMVKFAPHIVAEAGNQTKMEFKHLLKRIDLLNLGIVQNMSYIMMIFP